MKIKSIITILVTLFLVSACAGGKQISSGPEEPSVISTDSIDVGQMTGARPVSLAGLVEYAASQQYSPLDSIYNRPPEGMSDSYYVRLSESNEIVNIDQNVSAFTQKGDILAAGFRNGLIQIYGGGGCGAVQTESKPVNAISWFPGSRFLAASSGDNKFVEVFKVDECARVRVANLNSTVDMFAVSPKGSWLALVDEARRLWVGPVDGKLYKIHRFMYQPLSLSFSDEEGILMAVDVTGMLEMWSPLKLAKIFEHKIKGGPFKKIDVDGPYLNMETEKGERFCWDVSQRVRSAFHERQYGFFLKNSVLFYKSPRKRLSRKVYFKPVVLTVDYSPSGRVYKVGDVDGVERYYSSESGAYLEDVQDLADWENVKIGRDYRFSARGRDFELAVLIAQREFQKLYCRYIPGKDYYLWWKKVARPDDYFKSRGMVPRRNGISMQSPVEWESLESGRLDIRD